MATTIEDLKLTFDLPTMFAQCGRPIIVVIPFSGKQPVFTSCLPDGIEATMNNWEKAANIASAGDVELEAEAQERLRRIRLHLAEALAVFNPKTQRMIVKLDIFQFELSVEAKGD